MIVKIFFSLLSLLWILNIPLIVPYAQLLPNYAIQEVEDPHQPWDTLLGKYVDDEGKVDYKGFMKNKTALESYLKLLSEYPPAEQAARNEKLAYYINLYNAATVMLILENYPVKSIKDIKNPWDKEWIAIGDADFSLGQIEHDILRKMGEPRIHFAINCASRSCPKLLNSAFTANGLDSQLAKVTSDFLQDPSLNEISGDHPEMSMIFKWYKKDFTSEVPLREYINSYSSIKIKPGARISYKKYDWSLNDR